VNVGKDSADNNWGIGGLHIKRIEYVCLKFSEIPLKDTGSLLRK